MQWIQLAIFLLLVSGLLTSFNVRFNDFLHVLAISGKSTLQDDVDVLLGKPAKGFFNRETLEVEQLLKATGRTFCHGKADFHSALCTGSCIGAPHG